MGRTVTRVVKRWSTTHTPVSSYHLQTCKWKAIIAAAAQTPASSRAVIPHVDTFIIFVFKISLKTIRLVNKRRSLPPPRGPRHRAAVGAAGGYHYHHFLYLRYHFKTMSRRRRPRNRAAVGAAGGYHYHHFLYLRYHLKQ